MECFIDFFATNKSYRICSGVASVDNWRGEYSYTRVHKPLKQSISKEINSAEHDIWIFAPPIIDAGYATAHMWRLSLIQHCGLLLFLQGKGAIFYIINRIIHGCLEIINLFQVYTRISHTSAQSRIRKSFWCGSCPLVSLTWSISWIGF